MGTAEFTEPLQPEAPARKSWIKFVIGTIPLLAYVASGVGEGQITNGLFGSTPGLTPGSTPIPSAFDAPFLYVWLKSACRLLMWGVGLALAFSQSKIKKDSFSFAKFRYTSEVVTGPEGLTGRVFLKKYVPVAITLLTMQAGFSFSLRHIVPSVSMAIFTSTVAFSYIMSIIFTKNKIYLIKLIFVVVSFSGVALIAYDSITKAETTTTPSPPSNTTTTTTAASTAQEAPARIAWVGIVAILVSAMSLAVHQILYSRAYPNSDLIQASFIMTILGVINTILFFPVPLMLLLTGVETVDLSRLDYGILVAALICAFMVGFVYGYGLGITSPFFMSLGELLNLGTNTAIDIATKDIDVTPYQIAGLVVVAVSFFVLIVPDELVSIPLRRKPKTETEVSMQDIRTPRTS